VTEPLFTLLDIGARGSIDPRWHRFAGGLHVVAIDADESAETAPPRGVAKFETLHTAVGASDATVSLYLTRSPGCSSTLRPNAPLLATFPEPERFDVVEVRSVETRTLDAVLDAHQVAGVDFVKVDTQGSELGILQGGERTLAGAAGVEVEVEFLPLYEGQPLFADVDAHLRARGFELFDLNRVYWRRPASRAAGRGQLVFGDALYFRSAERLLSSAPDAGARVGKAVLAAAAYGYVDYARMLIEKGAERRLFTAGQDAAARRTLERARVDSGRLARLSRSVKGAGRAARAIARFADRLRPDDWSYVDGRLGNTLK
jgi:FkbM family methyltransferase